MRYAFIGLALLLVSCDPSAPTAANFPNPFGLAGQSLKLTRSANTSTVTWQGGFTDLPIVDETGATTKIPELYRGFTPGRLLERLGFETEMVAVSRAGRPGQFPDTFTFSAPNLQITIVDGDGVTSVTSDLTKRGTQEVTFSGKDCSQSTAIETVCAYKTTFSDAFLDLEYGGSDFRKFFNDILTAGESPNLLSATFTLSVRGTGGTLLGFPPSDTEARLVLKSSDGKLVF
jgi:hypothetical protein